MTKRDNLIELSLFYYTKVPSAALKGENNMAFGFYTTENESHAKLRHIVKWIVDLSVVLVFALFCVRFLMVQRPVTGHSMEPSLNNGDVVLVNEICYNFFEPERYDVVLFSSGEDKEKLYMKRVIGLPGETVQIEDGNLLVNGNVLNDAGTVTIPGLAEEPVILGDREYFLLGDNRDSSEDSRFPNVGNVLLNDMIGKVWLKISPLKELHLIK